MGQAYSYCSKTRCPKRSVCCNDPRSPRISRWGFGHSFGQFWRPRWSICPGAEPQPLMWVRWSFHSLGRLSKCYYHAAISGHSAIGQRCSVCKPARPGLVTKKISFCFCFTDSVLLPSGSTLDGGLLSVVEEAT